jgi:tetratricopeptide (TPR) repeat protein
MALSGLDRLRKSYESAILEKAKEASEDGFAAGLRYATLASYAEWHEIADSILEKLAENFAERYELLNNQGNLEFLLENYERAGQLYDKALQQKPDFIQGYLNRILLHKAMIENNFGHADSLSQAIGRDSLAVVKLYNSQYRDAGISLARLQGFAILEETGRGKAQGREKSATKDSLGTERKPLKVKERTLINKTKDFFTKLGQYLSPPDPRPRVKYVAAGRGSSPVLQATRLVELLYWSTPQIYSSLRAERSNL